MNENNSLRVLVYNIIFSIICIFITSILIIFYWPQNNLKEDIKLKINYGDPLSVIVKKLKNQKLISNELIFNIAVKLNGVETAIPAGIFLISDASNNLKLINNLVKNSPQVKKITLLEGWTTKQSIKYLAEEMGYDFKNFEMMINNLNVINDLGLNVDNIEGYIYPETYYFFEGQSELSIIKKIINEYKNFWNKENIARAKELKMTQHDIVTLASIIEGEAIYDSERSIISAVYHNRLNIGMKLQADPTVQYIIEDGPRRLLNKDLKINSPYNTYLNKGLPPGPINSPGRKSLLAALYPSDNEYLYFVAKGDGYHTFTKNEKDHEKAKKDFQKIRRRIQREKAGL